MFEWEHKVEVLPVKSVYIIQLSERITDAVHADCCRNTLVISKGDVLASEVSEVEIIGGKSAS